MRRGFKNHVEIRQRLTEQLRFHLRQGPTGPLLIPIRSRRHLTGQASVVRGLVRHIFAAEVISRMSRDAEYAAPHLELRSISVKNSGVHGCREDARE